MAVSCGIIFGSVKESVLSDVEGLMRMKRKILASKIKEEREDIGLWKKIKEIRENFSKAVVSGIRSRSGRIVYEH